MNTRLTFQSALSFLLAVFSVGVNIATIEIDGGVACDLAEPALSPAFAEVWGRAAGFSRKAIIGAPTQRAADTAALKLSVSLDSVTPKPQVSAKVKKGVRLVLTIEEPRK